MTLQQIRISFGLKCAYSWRHIANGRSQAYRKAQRILSKRIFKSSSCWAGGRNLSPIVPIGPPLQVKTVGGFCK